MPMIHRAAAAAIALAALLAATGAASPEEQSVIAKPGGTVAELAADKKACAAEAERARAQHETSPDGLAGQAVVDVMTDGNIIAEATQACLGRRGWAMTPLTPAEAKALAGHRTVASRDRWLEAFWAGDIAARVTAAMPEPFQSLPGRRDGPYLVGALKLDAASLTPAAGAVKAGGKDGGSVLLAGKAGYRATARLARDSIVRTGVVGLKFPAGALFHQLDYSPTGQGTPKWCAPAITGLAHSMMIWCFTEAQLSYDAMPYIGRPWLAGAYPLNDAGLYTPALPLRTVSPLALEAAEESGLPTFDITLELKALKGDKARLTATAFPAGTAGGKEKVIFWYGELDLRDGASARLPCWSRTLVLTRAGDTVTARFEDSGDGHGWPLRRGDAAGPG